MRTEYIWDGTQLIYENNGSRETMYYYDAAGQLVGFIVNGSTYYYVRNVQGDIIKILDGNMEEVVEYKYDTWGNVIGMEGSDYGKWVGSLNPFRYRGYYYDDEIGMYYLITRYYNPEWGRFLNADISLLGNVGVHLHNIFAYASNNPVVYSDTTGMGVFYSPGCVTYTTGTEVTNYVTTSDGVSHDSDRVKATRVEIAVKRFLKGFQALKSIFLGSSTSVITTKSNREVESPSLKWSPISFIHGNYDTTVLSQEGVSGVLASVDTKIEATDWTKSSLNLKVSGVNLSAGLDNLGLSASVGGYGLSLSYSLMQNTATIKGTYTTSINSNTTNTTYGGIAVSPNFLVNGLILVASSFFSVAPSAPDNSY